MVSVAKLRLIYRQHGIKLRKMKTDVVLKADAVQRQTAGRLFAFPRIVKAVKEGENIYFLDESVFSVNQSHIKVWSHAGIVGASIVRDRVGFEAVAAVAVINVHGGVVVASARQKSYNTDSFVTFLWRFR